MDITSVSDEKILKLATDNSFDNKEKEFISELFEMAKALYDSRIAVENSGDDSVYCYPDVVNARNNEVEKLADVQIMIWQMSLLLGAADGEFEAVVNKKIDRQISCIESKELM